MRWIQIVSLATLTGLSLTTACERDTVSAQPARCAVCGMRVEPASSWRAGLIDRSGDARLFDAPKCLFRFRFSDAGRGARQPWVIEYYSGERRPAEPLFYVLGSDVPGPMGRDLVPIEGRDRAERFLADHHGERVLTWGEIDPAIVDALFRP